jgi:hypothetical protein
MCLLSVGVPFRWGFIRWDVNFVNWDVNFVHWVHFSTKLVLFIRLLANYFFLYRLSKVGNEKYCYEFHARSGLRFIIRRQEDA